MIDWSKYPNFGADEFVHADKMDENFIRKLQYARTIYTDFCMCLKLTEIGFIITSSHRTKQENQQVGGTDDSTHLKGSACDLYVSDSRQRYLITKSLLLAGFQRIVIYDNHIHVDIDNTKDQHVLSLGKYVK